MCGVTYRLQKKNLPVPPPGAGPASVEEQQSDVQQAEQGREWAGEPYEGDDAPQGPDGAFSVFSHPGGEVAWLDRAEDGTLTGWVQATDGTLYQYTDADAWAVDVDGAGMAMVEGQGPAGDAGEDAMSTEDQQSEDESVDDLAGDDLAGDGTGEVDPLLEVEEDGEVDPFAEPEVEEPEDALAELGDEEDPDAEDPDDLDDPELDEFDSDEDDEDEEDEDPLDRFKKGHQGKYLMTVTTKK